MALFTALAVFLVPWRGALCACLGEFNNAEGREKAVVVRSFYPILAAI